MEKLHLLQLVLGTRRPKLNWRRKKAHLSNLSKQLHYKFQIFPYEQKIGKCDVISVELPIYKNRQLMAYYLYDSSRSSVKSKDIDWLLLGMITSVFNFGSCLCFNHKICLNFYLLMPLLCYCLVLGVHS